MSDKEEFLFQPRQEAHPMEWDNLMSPVRKALAELLIRIEGAERVVNEVGNHTDIKKEVANCFLVHGIRGTGKTTVLLSAQHALCTSNFIPPREGENAKKEKPEENTVRNAIKYLNDKYIVWLPILDLEPLPAKSNLLTIVLTHVLNALESSECGRKASTTSILEEGADSPRLKFKDLIRDATTIWEKIQEPDTRGKANRQVAAAEMYANFSKRFQELMTALSEQLGKKHGRDTKGCSVVLPIDNIDRNNDHLYAIVKYAQLISHNRLWLILAGEQKDIEAFLERGYWKDLNYKKADGDFPCRKNWENEDETLVMARRQAAAAYQKLLPPSHRIEIDRVQPEETLSFKPPDQDVNICNLLNSVKIILNESEKDKSKEEIPLFDLLAARKFITTPLVTEYSSKKSQEHSTEALQNIRSEILPKSNNEHLVSVDETTGPCKAQQKESECLTHLAKHALHLPARTVLDLWQLAHYVAKDKISAKGEQFQAERIARKMLRNAIYRSPISSRLGNCLQEDIIRRPSDGGTVLNFDRHEVSVKYLLKHNLEKIPKLQQQPMLGSKSRSTLCMMKREDIVIFLEKRGDIKKDKEDTENFITPELPDIVAAWLSILYDILMLVDRPAIIESINIESRLIMASHKMATFKECDEGDPKKFWWPAPLWKTFYAHDVFDKWWNKYYEDILGFNFLHLYSKNELEAVDFNARLLVARWIECVLRVFIALNKSPFPYYENLKSTGEKSDSKDNHETSKQTGKKQEPETDELDKIATEKHKNLKARVIKAFELIEKIPTFSRTKISEALTGQTKSKKNCNSEQELQEIANRHLETLEEKVIEAAHELYDAINYRDKKPVLIEEVHMKEWLEKKLPLLFSYLYAPLGETKEDAIGRCYDMFSEGPESDLKCYWKENASFFLADLDKELNDLFPREKILKVLDSDKKLSNDAAYIAYINSLGSFGALHQFWKPEDY